MTGEKGSKDVPGPCSCCPNSSHPRIREAVQVEPKGRNTQDDEWKRQKRINVKPENRLGFCRKIQVQQHEV